MSQQTVSPDDLRSEAQIQRALSSSHQSATHGFKLADATSSSNTGSQLDQARSTDMLNRDGSAEQIDTMNERLENSRLSAVDAAVSTRQQETAAGLEPIAGALSQQRSDESGQNSSDMSVPSGGRQVSDKQRARELEADLINGAEA